MANIIKTTSSPGIPPSLITDPYEIDALSKRLMNSIRPSPSEEEKAKEDYRLERARQRQVEMDYMKQQEFYKVVTTNQVEKSSRIPVMPNWSGDEYFKHMMNMKEMMTRGIGTPSPIVEPGVRTKEDISFDHNGEKFIVNRAQELAMREFTERKHREMFDKLIHPRVVEDEWPVEKIQKCLDEIYAEEKDMDQTWEFDLESGAFKSGDIVVDVDGYKFFVAEKGLLPMDDKAKHAIETNPSGRGTLRLMASAYSDTGVDEGVAEKPSYTKLSMKSLEDAIGKAFEKAPDDFVIYTGARGARKMKKAMKDVAAEYPLTMDDAVKKQQHLVLQYGDYVSIKDAHAETLNDALHGLITGEGYDYDMTPEDVRTRVGAIKDEINSRRDASEVQMMSTLGMEMYSGRKKYAGGGLLDQINEHSVSKLLESMGTRNMQDDERRKFTMFNVPKRDLYLSGMDPFDSVINPLPPSPGGGHGAMKGFSLLKWKFNKLLGL